MGYGDYVRPSSAEHEESDSDVGVEAGDWKPNPKSSLKKLKEKDKTE